MADPATWAGIISAAGAATGGTAQLTKKDPPQLFQSQVPSTQLPNFPNYAPQGSGSIPQGPSFDSSQLLSLLSQLSKGQ